MTRTHQAGWIPTLALTLFALGACDKQDAKPESDKAVDKSEKAEAKKPKVEEQDPSKPSADWSKQAISKLDDEVDGIKFSIELPANLRREVKASDGSFPGYVTWNGANPFMDPSFTVQIDSFPPADLAAAARKASTHPQPAEVTRQEDLPEGGMLVSYAETSKEFVQVLVWRKAGDKVLRVTVQTRNSDPIPDIDALRAWMEKVASSLTVAA